MKRPSLFWTDDEKSTGEMLRQRRLALGIEQVELARRLGCTPGFVANVEAGRRYPATPLLFQWARELKMMWGFIATEEIEPPENGVK